MMQNRKALIGLTGGIATGKSTVSAILREKGIIVIDADAVARRLAQRGGPVWQAILENFGSAFFSPEGELNRRALGEVVFSDPKSRDILNTITHPVIGSVIQQEVNALRTTGYEGMIVIDAAVLIESGWYRMVDEVWLVTSPTELQIERLMKRDGLSEKQAMDRIDSQLNQQEKLRYARQVIVNDQGLEQLHQQVEELLAKI